MSGVFERLIKVVESSIETEMEELRSWIDRNSNRNFEQKQETAEEDFRGNSFSYQKTSSLYPAWVIEDLDKFGLKEPSSLEEIKTARKQEMKKYHPDFFAQEPMKQDIAKQILQIYNNAYERLKKYFSEMKDPL